MSALTPEQGFRRYVVRTVSGDRYQVDLEIVPDPGAPNEQQNVGTLVGWVGRGKWIESIDGWKINPRQVEAIRLQK